MISAKDIIFVLSGGTINTDPSQSLGGDPSMHRISASINSLFDNVSETEANDGHVDYRCIYIFNNSEIGSFRSVSLFLGAEQSVDAEGASINVGTISNIDVQRIRIDCPVDSGTFTLSYEGTLSNSIEFNADSIITAANIELAVNELLRSLGVRVLGVGPIPSSVGASYYFDVYFEEDVGGINHDILVVESNDLMPETIVDVSKVAQGGPINAIAASLDFDTISPNGVIFSYPTRSNPIVIGNLRSGDGFPIWVKRTVLPATEAKFNDCMIIVVRGWFVDDSVS